MFNFAEKVLNAPLGHTYLFSVGQAGYIIKSTSGRLIAIDLYLSDCVEPAEGHIGFKRLLPKILAPEELVFDAVIATHPHLDHFDADAIPLMMQNGVTRLFASTECEKEVDRLHISKDRTVFVSPGDTCTVGDVALYFVNCDHGAGAPDAVGVLACVDGRLIYEAGDTCLRLDRVEEITKRGRIDVMIAPINGAYGNMNEEECAVYSSKIDPGLTIPCHYGMFASHGGDPGKFLGHMKKICPDNKVMLMQQGEQLML